MVEKISDVKKANAAGAYQAGLALALSFPDICGQVEYPSCTQVGKRYVDWCNNYLDFSETSWGGDFAANDLCGDMIYALRCAFLHSGNDDVLDTSHGGKTLTVTSFELVKPNGAIGQFGYRYKSSATEKTVEFDIEYLCDILCQGAEKYYDSYPDKTAFDSHNCLIR